MENREIKFRAWDGEFMITQDNLDELKVQELRMGVMCDSPTDGEQTPIKVMQYTGLKDRLGKEIYEGDILRVFDENYEVKIINTESKCFVDYGFPDEHNGPAPDWVEVIGNIYENPDLLKKGER